MGKYIFDKLVSEWGVSKTAQVAVITITGASLFGSIAAVALPNNPTITEKEKESN